MATAKKQDVTKDPSHPSAAYSHMAPKWRMIATLLGGTQSMRDAGEDYLPKHSAESQHDYEHRLASSVLYNVTELTLGSLVGRVFREPLKYTTKNTALEDFATDVDSQEHDLSSFSQMWFREAMAKGFAHVFVDMPSLSEEQKAKRTRLDDLKENRKPFWSLIIPENVIFMYSERVNGDDVLMHARVVEYETTMVGFAEVVHVRIRVLTPGAWERWYNKNEDDPKKTPEWIVLDAGVYDLPIIPLVTFYSDLSHGAMTAKPPLEDLAYLNIRHWQSNSDQINILTVSRFPMLAASGAQIEQGKNSMPIGPRQLLTMRDPNGRFYYVEHTGRAISAGKEDLEMLEDRMAAYGSEFLRRQISGRTAFERAQDTNEAISPLMAMATLFESSVDCALCMTAQWLKIDDSEVGSVALNKEYTQEEDKSDPMTTLSAARARGDISLETWIEEAKKRRAVDPTLDTAEEMARIKQERVDGFTVDPSQPYSTKIKQTTGEIDEEATAGVTDATTPTPAPKTPVKKPTKKPTKKSGA